MKRDYKKGESQSRVLFRSIMRNKTAVICLVFVFIMIFIAVFDGMLFDYENDVIAQDINNSRQAPSAEHWFGTDIYGRDYFARVIYATRITLLIALCSTSGGVILGFIIGAISGYCGGMVDNVIQRFLDVIISIPSIILMLCVVAVTGGGTWNICLALIIAMTPSFARATRSVVMVSSNNEYIEAARASGASHFRIIFEHILPNSAGTLLIFATHNIGACILSTAGLGYLGLGVKPPQPEWGVLLSEAKKFMRADPYLIVFPGVAIVLSTLVFNLLGDSLRDALDPRLRGYEKPRKKLFKRRKA